MEAAALTGGVTGAVTDATKASPVMTRRQSPLADMSYEQQQLSLSRTSSSGRRLSDLRTTPSYERRLSELADHSTIPRTPSYDKRMSDLYYNTTGYAPSGTTVARLGAERSPPRMDLKADFPMAGMGFPQAILASPSPMREGADDYTYTTQSSPRSIPPRGLAIDNPTAMSPSSYGSIVGYCGSCGEPLREQQRFCVQCGRASSSQHASPQ